MKSCLINTLIKETFINGFFYLEFFSLISLSQILSDDSLASKPTLSLTLSDHQEAVSPEFLRCFL